MRAALEGRSTAAICRASSTSSEPLGEGIWADRPARWRQRGAVAASARTGELGGQDAHDDVVVPLAVEPAALLFAAFLHEATLAV